MNIIASAILVAASYTWTPETSIDEGFMFECTPVTVTNEPFATLFDMQKKVEVLWTAHTNKIARIEAHKAKVTKDKSAIERVKENAKKHKSAMGKSLPTGGNRK